MFVLSYNATLVLYHIYHQNIFFFLCVSISSPQQRQGFYRLPCGFQEQRKGVNCIAMLHCLCTQPLYAQTTQQARFQTSPSPRGQSPDPHGQLHPHQHWHRVAAVVSSCHQGHSRLCTACFCIIILCIILQESGSIDQVSPFYQALFPGPGHVQVVTSSK